MTSVRPSPSGLSVAIPGADVLHLSHLLIDFNGTLAHDGQLIAGVAERLTALNRLLEVEVLTGDTYGTVARAMSGLPVRHTVVLSGADKTARAKNLLNAGVAAIGNGRNDADMLRTATLGVAVLGPECSHALTLAAAQLVAPNILAALDLFLLPQRLIAGLRP